MTRFPTPPFRNLLLGSTLSLAAVTVQAQSCDCTCSAFGELEAALETFEQQANEGAAVMPSTALQQQMMCASECAMQWAQCESGPTREDQSDRPAQASSHAPPAQTQANVRSDVQSSKPSEIDRGPARDDLLRFFGVYEAEGRPNQQIFVTESGTEPGFLMIGAMWGDASPWIMRSVSDHRFEESGHASDERSVADFELDSTGNAKSLSFPSGVISDWGSFRRVGDLPDGW